ncbi:MAG: signal peptidase II [Candidatus Eisenbacteria bacterium]|uniref:Lipoprotein signal peptidase n=1 Tax=Eiseniibacteriota bacterium TaxID=2212470 RepID=A0A9D6L8S3_UNCEI|nr:signal peptidase II [Candidatus Eisenbacteria bacterium]
MKPRPGIPALLAIAAAIVAADWWTKRWATATLAGHPSLGVIGEFMRFTYTRNSGVAFGLGAGLPFPYYVFSIIAAVAIVYLFLRQRVPSPARRIALALILGGALGNLVDRVRFGEVVDFIEIGWGRWHWPVFNVADSAVSIGVVLFAIAWPKREAAGDGGRAAPDGGDAADASDAAPHTSPAP